MSVMRCSAPTADRLGASGPAHLSLRNNATKFFKLGDLSSTWKRMKDRLESLDILLALVQAR
jgi:hypothetical protein